MNAKEIFAFSEMNRNSKERIKSLKTSIEIYSFLIRAERAIIEAVSKATFNCKVRLSLDQSFVDTQFKAAVDYYEPLGFKVEMNTKEYITITWDGK